MRGPLVAALGDAQSAADEELLIAEFEEVAGLDGLRVAAGVLVGGEGIAWGGRLLSLLLLSGFVGTCSDDEHGHEDDDDEDEDGDEEFCGHGGLLRFGGRTVQQPL